MVSNNFKVSSISQLGGLLVGISLLLMILVAGCGEEPGSPGGSREVEISPDNPTVLAPVQSSETPQPSAVHSPSNLQSNQDSACGDTDEIKAGQAVEGSIGRLGWKKYCLQADKDLVYLIETAEDGQLQPYSIEVSSEKLAPEDSNLLLNAYGFGAFAPPSSGTYYLWVSGGPGAYSLSLSALSDDHANYPEEATLIDNGETLDGNIEYQDDVDIFSFQVEEGVGYRVNVSAGTSTSARMELDNRSGGARVVPTVEYGDRAVWIPTHPETLYVKVWGEAGTYSLSLSSFRDDHVDQRDTDDATGIEPGQTLDGLIEHEADVDVFRFQPKKATKYIVLGHPGTNSNVALEMCQHDAQFCDEDAVSTGDAPATLELGFQNYVRVHYIRVSSFDKATGSYSISLSETPTN